MIIHSWKSNNIKHAHKNETYCKLSCQFAVQALPRMTSLLEHTVASQPNVDFCQKKTIPQNNTVLQKWGHAMIYA